MRAGCPDCGWDLGALAQVIVDNVGPNFVGGSGDGDQVGAGLPQGEPAPVL